ncbi:MAG: hypothetical protein MI867_18085 [Pseudomonadales bacterium]|nr:hypothetical protein [Pseudomonadales bacterium]
MRPAVLKIFNYRYLSLVLLFSVSGYSHALIEPLLDNGEWSYELGAEWRHFDDPGEFGQDRDGLSLRIQPEFYTEWNDGDDFFKFVPFMRIDSVDDERTHFDLRDAYWGHIGNSWELKLGYTTVFWGRTEFLNLVDVINQKDFVEGDRDSKLGQPLLHLSFVHDVGILDFYALLGFRERTFPGVDGRLRTPIPVDTDNPRYGDGVSKDDIGFAVRWGQPIGDYVEIAVSLFSGISREPWFDFNWDLADPKLIPVYYHMEQLGFEFEFIYEGWVAKLEAIGVESQRENYTAAVGGVEYTFGSVFESDIDITLISEYLWDERGDASPGFLEQDIGLGMRLTFNDEQSTEILFGGLIDPDTEEKILTLEASRRIGDSWKIKVLGAHVLARGEEEASQTSVDAVQLLTDSGLLAGGGLDYEFLVDWAIETVQTNGLDILFDQTFGLNTLNQLQRLANADRKLSILESDNYVQFEMTFFY